MITKERLYFKPHQEAAVDDFINFMEDNPHVRFYFPNEAASPWHVIGEVKGEHYDELVHFYPHKWKAYAEGHGTKQGPTAYYEALEQAQKDANTDCEVIDEEFKGHAV